jgi:translocation and assembly module TamB
MHSENLTLRGQGGLTDEWRLEGPLRVAANTRAINRLLPEYDLEAGGGSIEGDATFSDALSNFSGRARLERIGEGDVRADLVGPVSATWGPRAVNATMRFGLTPRGSQRAQRLLAGGRLSGRVTYDRLRENVEIRNALLEGRALRIDASGRVGDESGALAGRWRVSDLAAAAEAISGAAGGDWRAARERDRPWRIVAQGRAQNVRARNPTLGQLLGSAPRLSFDGEIAEGGVRIRRAAVEGAKLRAAATGRFADTLDLRLEASARGPLRLGDAEIAGIVDATGTITGARAQPRLDAQARMQRFDVAGLAIEQPVLDFDYDFGARTGEAAVNGFVAGQAARAHAFVRSERDALVLSDLTAQGAGLVAEGDASFGAAGPAFNLAFSGELSGLRADATGRIQGRARLAPARGAARLDVQARLERAAFGDLRVSQASLSAQGPLNQLAASLQLRGFSEQAPVALDASARIASNNGRTLVSLLMNGDLGGEKLATRTPARIEIVRGRIDAQASLIAGDGSADIVWRGGENAFAASARFDRAELAPLAILFGDRAEGTLSGDMRLASAGAGLRGGANLSIDDLRLPARMRAPLDMRIDARLDPRRITGTATATSADGLEASLQGDIPVTTDARSVRIALAQGGEGRASWRAHGPADALWGLVGGLDQSLGGQVNGMGQIRFTTRTLRGSGELVLAGGRFEDRRSGLSLVDVDARLQFSETGASQFTIAARDPEGGTLTGSGSARGMRDGDMTLALQRLRLLNREDLRATASGDLAVNWSGQGARVSGALRLDEAQLSLQRRSRVVVPEIEVVEINQPYGDLPAPEPRGPGLKAELDLTVSAPGRVYTRGRGLDAEWSLNARVRGTSAEPLLYGEARIIRGQFALAGRPFDLERGVIRLMGPLDETRIELVAERRDTAITTRVQLGDRLFDPTITLSSDPAMAEDEILPNMLFGRSAEDLSALEAAQLAASLSELTGRAAFDLTGALRAAVGLQRFDIRQGEGGVVITGGRYLTRDVYFEVTRTGEGLPGARLEWRARRNLSLVTSFLSDGDQRVSVRWRRDY